MGRGFKNVFVWCICKSKIGPKLYKTYSITQKRQGAEIKIWKSIHSDGKEKFTVGFCCHFCVIEYVLYNFGPIFDLQMHQTKIFLKPLPIV